MGNLQTTSSEIEYFSKQCPRCPRCPRCRRPRNFNCIYRNRRLNLINQQLMFENKVLQNKLLESAPSDKLY